MVKLKIILAIIILPVVVLANNSNNNNNNNNCLGGAVFLNPNNNNNNQLTSHSEKLYYTKTFSYNCQDTNDFNKQLEKNIQKVNDPFVKSFQRNRRDLIKNHNNNKEGSGNYDEDSEDSEDDDDSDEEDDLETDDLEDIKNYITTNEEVIEPSENIIIQEIEPSKKFNVPVEPTPSINRMIQMASSSSSVAMTEKSSIIATIKPTPQIIIPMTTSPSYYYSSVIMHSAINSVLIGSGDFESPMETVVVTTPPTTETILLKLPKTLLHSGHAHSQVITHSNHLKHHNVANHNFSCKLSQQLDFLHLQDENDHFEIFSLPTIDSISDYEFEINCHNNGTKLIYESFYSIRQRQKSRNYYHIFKISFATVQRDLKSLSNNLIEKVKNSQKVNDLVIINYNLKEFPFYFTYVNETLIDEEKEKCPMEILKSIYANLKNNYLNKTINYYKIISINLNHYGNLGICSNENFEEKSTIQPKVNYPPSIKNPIDVISGFQGIYLTFKIPHDFCYDPEDGDTSKLKLSLKNLKTFEKFDGNFWMQFDDKNKEVFGLPMEIGETGAVIVCEDSGGKTATDSLHVTITTLAKNKEKYSALFSLHFQSLPWKPLNIKKFFEKLSEILSPEILVHSVTVNNDNYVHFKWYNTSNPGNEYELTEIRKRIWSDEGGVKKGVKMFFSPEFNLTDSSGGVVPVGGVLLGGGTPVEDGGNKGKNINGGLFDFDGNSNGGGGGGVVKGDSKESEYDGSFEFSTPDWIKEWTRGTYLTTYILPSILIAVMILLALIIACLLSRKKRLDSSPSNISLDYPEEKSKFIVSSATGTGTSKKAVPVIFQEELEQQQQMQMQMRQQQQHQGGGAAQPLPPSYSQQQQQGFVRGVAQGRESFGRGSFERSSLRSSYNNLPPSYQQYHHHQGNHHQTLPQHTTNNSGNNPLSTPPSYPDPYSRRQQPQQQQQQSPEQQQGSFYYQPPPPPVNSYYNNNNRYGGGYNNQRGGGGSSTYVPP